MHIGGEGDSVRLASAVKKIQDTVKEIRAGLARARPELRHKFAGRH